MKKFLFKSILLISLLFFNTCKDEGICSCGTSCTVAENGEISCSLDGEAFTARKEKFQKLFFSKAVDVNETLEGYQFVFKDEKKLNEQIFKFILEEKKCCPFFQYDIKVLPYSEGIHLTISGDEKVKEFLTKLL